jgi:hypothetical protein
MCDRLGEHVDGRGTRRLVSSLNGTEVVLSTCTPAHAEDVVRVIAAAGTLRKMG